MKPDIICCFRKFSYTTLYRNTQMNDLKVSCSSCKIVVKAKGAGIYGLFLQLGAYQTLPVSPNARFPLKDLSPFLVRSSSLPQAQKCYWTVIFTDWPVLLVVRLSVIQKNLYKLKFKIQSVQEIENRLNRHILCSPWGKRALHPLPEDREKQLVCRF